VPDEPLIRKEKGKSMNTFAIAADLSLGAVELTVADMSRALGFYEGLLGLQPHEVGDGERRVELRAGTAPLLRLYERPGARRKPPRTTGLYHVALLAPSRRELARTLARLAEARYPLGGASDHLVSEALYLDDPDGNGLEIYADRPRAAWPRAGREVRMAVDPLDLAGLLAERGDEPWTGMAAATVIGHIHLHVASLPETEAFYGGVLGFELMQRFPGALFMAAGGYHHHLGLNTWAGVGAPPAPADAVGLRRFTLLLPDADALEAVAAQVRSAELPATERAGGLELRDPSGNTLLLEAL
jgi:catechol 2,3-dioxygenase